MDKENKLRVENLDRLIEDQDNLKKLTNQDAWKLFMKIISEMRVDAMDAAVHEGDTTDQKAEARAYGKLINIFYTWEDETYKDDLIRRRESLLKEIRNIESERRPMNDMNQGLSSAI